MQEEQKIFQEKLLWLVKKAKANQGIIRADEVEQYLRDWQLDRSKLEMVMTYLTAEQIRIEGYEPAESSAEEAGESAALTREEQQYLEQYEKELSELPIVDPADRDALFARMEKGDALAKSSLLTLYLPIVVAAAKEFHTAECFIGDLIQEGNVNLLLALDERIEPEMADAQIRAKIREGMREFVNEQYQQKSQDDTVVNRVNRLKEAIEELSDGEEMNFSIAELSAYLDMSVEEIEDILRLTGEE